MAKNIRFDSHEYVVRVDVEPSPLMPELEDAVRAYRASLVPEGQADAKDGGRRNAIARIDWRLVLYSAAIEAGVSLHWDFADAIDGDLLQVTSVLWDEKTGFPNEKSGIDGGVGSDLLLIDSIRVGAKFDMVRVGRELLEHVIFHFGSGCMAAAYLEDEEPNPAMDTILLDRGFRHRKKDRLYLADLAYKRPPWPGDEAPSKTWAKVLRLPVRTRA